MLISNVSQFGCQKVRNIFNAIGCCNFGTIPAAGKRNISNLLLDSLNCKCIHRIPAHYQQLRNFHQTVPTLSSQSISKSETEDNDEQQLHQPSVKEENQEVKKSNANQQQTLAKNYTSIGSNHYLNIICDQGSSGQKYIEIKTLIFKLSIPIFYKMAKILVPQEAYKFISAMDRLIGQLPEERPTNPTEGEESPTVLATQMVEGGLRYDFKLSVVWHPESGQWDLEIRSVKTVQVHNERSLHFPLWALSWLRQQMASMLVKHDGSEQTNEPPTMPEWAKARNLRTSSMSPKQKSRPKSKSSPKNPATPNNVSAQLQQQQQQLAQLQAQLAQLTSAMTMNNHNHQTPSFNPDGFMANPTTPLNPPFTPAYPNPALQSTTADASALVAQLIDQLKKANGTAAVSQSKQQTQPNNRKKD